MTGTKGNSEFCIIQNSLFPTLPVIKCYASQLKNCMLDAGWHTNLLLFQGVWPDHVLFESPSCCFCRELVSFYPRHITGSPPIENVFELAGIAKAA